MLRLLLLTSTPPGSVPLRVDEECRLIDERIRSSDYRFLFDVRHQLAARVADLQGCLLRHRPDIIHFSGHGTGRGELLLHGEAGAGQSVPADALTDLFARLGSGIRCVVLNACFTEQQADAIAEHIDLVIGMRGSVTDHAAIAFAGAFYQALAYGESVKSAFDLGCNQIWLEGCGGQHIPRLIARRVDPAGVTFASADEVTSTTTPVVNLAGTNDLVVGPVVIKYTLTKRRKFTLRGRSITVSHLVKLGNVLMCVGIAFVLTALGELFLKPLSGGVGPLQRFLMIPAPLLFGTGFLLQSNGKAATKCAFHRVVLWKSKRLRLVSLAFNLLRVSDGSFYLVDVIAKCSLCGGAVLLKDLPAGSDEKTMGFCDINPDQHAYTFDPTTLVGELQRVTWRQIPPQT